MIDHAITLFALTLAAGTVLVFPALGELITEKAGVLNLGVEGMMLVGAVVAFIVADETGHPDRRKRALTPPAIPVPPMTRSPEGRPDTPTRPPNSPEHDHLDLGRDLAASSPI